MERTFLLKGIDCPNCSMKIEDEVGKIEGVKYSNVNLLKQTLTIVTEDNKSSVEEDIKEIVHKHEPDIEVSEYENTDKIEKSKSESIEKRNKIIRLSLGAAIFILSIIIAEVFEISKYLQISLFILAYIILGYDVIIKAFKNISKGLVFDENFLMSISTIGAFIIGEYPEAVAVMLFYQVGEFFQWLAVNRSRRSIAELMDIRPDVANVLKNGKTFEISPENVEIGEIIIVKPGEKIPLDGIVLEGMSMIDTKALTGESVPRKVKVGEEVLSGCINQTGLLKIEVTKQFKDATVSKIIDLVENAASKKAKAENFITKFARYYTPVVVILAILLATIPPIFFGAQFVEWLRRALVFLVISCPCALVISVPLTFFSGIGTASKNGILVKGSNYLEALNNLDAVVFDKTGTLTKGVFKVVEIVETEDFTKSEILKYAAVAESFSNHPIAKSILSEYDSEINKQEITNYKEVAGEGVSVNYNNRHILAGNLKLMQSENIIFTQYNKTGTKVYVAVDKKFAGVILISDEIKEDSKNAIKGLKNKGIDKIIMLTGDDDTIARDIAQKLNIDEVYSGLLPHEKTEKLEMLNNNKTKGKKIAFVGDGINDAPVLALADIGIAMGGLGSDAAIEAADIVLMTDETSKLVKAIEIAKKTRSIVIQNISIALLVKGLFLILGAIGIAGMWEAVFGDVGVTLIAVLNSMRMRK